MSIGVPGNSVIVNILMRWPPLIPVATAAVITTAVVPPVVATPSIPKSVPAAVVSPVQSGEVPLAPQPAPLPPAKKKRG